MTLLDTIIYNSLELSTIGSELYTTSTSLESIVIDDNLKGTLLCTTISSVLDSIHVPTKLMSVRDAQSYVQSMSVEELENFEKILAEKELEFEFSEEQTTIIDAPKTYKKT